MVCGVTIVKSIASAEMVHCATIKVDFVVVPRVGLVNSKYNSFRMGIKRGQLYNMGERNFLRFEPKSCTLVNH